MKKTLIASAVAAVSMASVAQAAEMSNMPEFYGNIQLAYVHDSEETGNTEVTTNEFKDNGTTLGVKHSHEIAPGLTGFLKAELEFDADDKKTSTGLSSLDEAYIGVKGDFGSAQIGSDDTVYEWWDVIDISEAVGIAGEFDGVAEGDNFQYVSPTIAGGLTVGVTLPLTPDDDNAERRHAAALGAKYKTDMFEVIFGYSMGREVFDKDSSDKKRDVGDSFGLGGNIFLGDLTIGLEYESKSADSVGGGDDKSSEKDGYGLIAIYSLGASQLAAGYAAYEDGEDGDAQTEVDKFYLQALHNISDNMYAYVEYTNGSKDVGSTSTDTEEFALGATYTF